ncbi:MAG: hypothetical protein AABW86_02975 [Candidatus Micrarchaeota archaeon]
MKKLSLLVFIIFVLPLVLYAPGAGGGSGGFGTNPGGSGGTGSSGGTSGFTGQGGEIYDALYQLCQLVKNSLAVGMMFMVVSASLVYAVGQVMGAETRARASVWATSMFNGAIIAALIYLLVPFVLEVLLKNTGTGIPTC